jgi:hypothetical protein
LLVTCIKQHETFGKPNNPAMPISSRRYLSVYKNVVKYLVFAWKGAESYGLMGTNTKYFITKESGGISFEISFFRNSHSLFQEDMSYAKVSY